MLKIPAIRATLGKSVTAKLKNRKDDSELVIEFSLLELSLTQAQLTDLVACSKHERKFADVAFTGRDAMSELRHFKKMVLEIEVHDAAITINNAGVELQLVNCSLKKIDLSFHGNERCEISCKVWAPLEELALYTLGEWVSQDVFASVLAKEHGKEIQGPNEEMNV